MSSCRLFFSLSLTRLDRILTKSHQKGETNYFYNPQVPCDTRPALRARTVTSPYGGLLDPEPLAPCGDGSSSAGGSGTISYLS